MDSDYFLIECDPGRCLIRITLRGHWTVETIRSYEKAVHDARAEMVKAGCVLGTISALVDMRTAGVQSQKVIAMYKTWLEADDVRPRRIATLLTSALLKRQVNRIAAPNQRLFDDEREALAWLLSPD